MTEVAAYCKKETISVINQRRLAKGIRWAARVIGLVITAFSLMFLIGETVGEILAKGWQPVTMEGLTVGILLVSTAIGRNMNYDKGG